MSLSQPAPATAPAASTAGKEAPTQVIEISGVRATLARSLAIKREAIGTRDSIPAKYRGRKITWSLTFTQSKSNNSNNPRGQCCSATPGASSAC